MEKEESKAEEFFKKVQKGFINEEKIKSRKYLKLGVEDLVDFTKINKGHIKDIYYLKQAGKLNDKEMKFLQAAIEEESKIKAETYKRISPAMVEDLVKGLLTVIFNLLITL